MNIKKQILGLGAFLLVIGLFFLSSTHAHAAVKKLNILNDYKKKSCKADLDGDGKKEKLELKWKGVSVSKAILYVNGKKALQMNDPSWVFSIGVDYIKMSESDIFLRCYTSGDSYITGSDYFYRYDSAKKKLVKVTKLMDINENGNSTKVKAVTSSEVKVTYCHNLDVVGHVLWTAIYVLKDGKLKLKPTAFKAQSAYTTKYGDQDGYGKLLEKSQYKATCDLLFYTDRFMREVAYTVNANDIVILKKIKYVKGNWYVQFEKDGEKGWTGLKGYGSREIFYGVNARMMVG
ncbi:MAG TPA: hypothetical protein DCZ23_02410 [Lachnospiraceae bacterium]|nr:hypothetical protein [Lachnospiraceae bacterium]